MKKIILILLAVISCFIGIKSVEAAKLNRSFVDNAWAFRYRGGKVYTYGQLNIKKIDGKIGYCIESDVNIYADDYNENDNWSISGYSEEDKKKMELYAYYGYEYPNHNTTKYYMATQELIWLLSKDEEIKWTKEDNSSSEVIDVSKEKSEILNLVSKHDLVPSFDNNTLNTTSYGTVKVTDYNGVLNNYENDKNIEYSSNKIYVSIENKKMTINFKQKSVLNDKTIVYTSNDNKSQKIAVFGNPKLNSATLFINPVNVKMTIRKLDKETNEIITYKGIKIKLKDINSGAEYGPYEFSNGNIILTLPASSYMVEEISTTGDYLLNNSCPTFTVTLDDKDFVYNFFNKKVKGKIRIKKVDENGNFLEGTVFNVYDSNDDLVDTIITTNNEFDESKELPLGKYYVKEISTLYGYKIDNKVYNANLTFIDENTPLVYKDIESINNKVKCELTYISKDEEGNNLNTSYEVYDLNNNLIYKGNEEKIELSYGKYYLVQTDVPNGFKLNEEKVFFEVNDYSCLTNIKLINKKVNMPITSTSINILSTSIFII